MKHYYLLSLALLSLMSAPFASAQSDDEITLAIPVLEAGDSVQATFDQTMTTRLYGFNATEGDEVTISMIQDDPQSILDPFLVLFDSEGAIIAYDDDGGNDAVLYSALIKAVTLPADGSYFVLATSYTFLQSPMVLEEEEGFELTLEGITAPPNLEGLTLLTAPVEIDRQYPVPLTVETPIAFFTYNGSADESFNLNLESNDFDTLLYVFAPDGERLVISDDRGNADTNSSAHDIVLPEDGTYLIAATSFDFYRAKEEDFQSVGMATLTVVPE